MELKPRSISSPKKTKHLQFSRKGYLKNIDTLSSTKRSTIHASSQYTFLDVGSKDNEKITI